MALALVWALALTLTIAVGASTNSFAAKDPLFPELIKWHVYVVNGLSNNQNLVVRCKSKDDDLGIHNLYVGSNFTWSFKTDFFHSTLFWCYSIAFLSFYVAQGEEDEKGTKEARQVLKILEEEALGEKNKYFGGNEIGLVDLVSIAFMSFYVAQGEEHEKATKEAREVLKILEEEALGEKNKYFGGNEIGLVDLVIGWIAMSFGMIEEAAGVKLLNANDFPRMLAWIHNFRENPLIKPNLPIQQDVLAYYKEKRQIIIKSKTA
ncbi:putative glutathione S-transferase [Senna tora]|uniref:Putative glutathione S-transferase n=1 Tax=Senna tora TaxID=362788 RepID=A0A834WCN7_9FABA|nr:putative glutathione S-transferase [Senna tora]